jgi:peptidyl-prolyl cis-trans isomerase B (cyclophilin B)
LRFKNKELFYMAKKGYIQMKSGDKIEFELYPNEAPGTVENFETLAKKGFYDGLTFHRVIPGFVSQGGCPHGTGTGGPGYTIKCETEGNPHKHEAGSLSMAHAGKDTGGSQFFIVHEPQPHLNGVHTVFGKVSSGLEVAKAMRNGDVMEKVVIED